MARKRGLLGSIFAGLWKGATAPRKARVSLQTQQQRQARASSRKKVEVRRFGKRR